MSQFDRNLPGFRFAEVRYGDTMQGIALRELGDATRWPELVALNNLLPPYLTDDPALASDRVILSGQSLVIPAPVPVVSSEIDPEAVFQADVVLDRGQLVDDGLGDFALVSGRDNLLQFLRHAVATERGELIFHGRYGCSAQRVIGTMNGQNAALLVREYIRATIEADSRVREVSRIAHEVQGDVLRVAADVVPVSGSPFSFEVGVSAAGVRF